MNVPLKTEIKTLKLEKKKKQEKKKQEIWKWAVQSWNEAQQWPGTPGFIIFLCRTSIWLLSSVTTWPKMASGAPRTLHAPEKRERERKKNSAQLSQALLRLPSWEFYMFPHIHLIDLNIVMWPHPTASKPGKCSFLFRYMAP